MRVSPQKVQFCTTLQVKLSSGAMREGQREEGQLVKKTRLGLSAGSEQTGCCILAGEVTMLC